MILSENKHAAQGKDIINQLAIILRSGHFHDLENDAVLESIMKFRDIVNHYVETEGSIKVELVNDIFYVNDVRIRFPLEFLLNFDYIAEEFRRREIGSVSFLSQTRVKDIKMLLSSFNEAATSQTPFDTIISLLDEIPGIMIGKWRKSKESEVLNRRKIVKKTYFNAVAFTKGVIKGIKAGETVSIKKAKRLIGSMVDALLSEEQLLIGMTSIKDYDEYTFHHSVNVSILSIALGQRIGLNRNKVTALGIAALFHDLGKAEVPYKVLNKPSVLNEEDWKVIQKHPLWGALSLLKLKGIDDVSMQSAIVAFQHHMNCDFSGYPKLAKPIELTFFSKIISIADKYDAMTSSRVYNKQPLTPEQAIGNMMVKSEKEVDPILLKFFINMVGNYPVGSLVMLDTREMGIVLEGNRSIPERPRVMVIVDSSGNEVEEYMVDLTEQDASGSFMRTIVKTIDPKEHSISLAKYLL